jgi:hypothetical protein
MAREIDICYLCGQKLDTDMSDDHVPPKQFFPKKLRTKIKFNLQTAPSHKKCNGDYKNDEEYFYHCMYAAVERCNQKMAKSIYDDLQRRANKPQTRAMARRLLKDFKKVTEGGIHLPDGIVQFAVDEYRIQRVALKIAQGLVYLETNRHMPLENAKDIRLCLEENEVPELYQLGFRASPIKGSCPQVFSYRYFKFDTNHLLSMFFWESFMFCTLFDEAIVTRSS